MSSSMEAQLVNWTSILNLLLGHMEKCIMLALICSNLISSKKVTALIVQVFKYWG